MAKREPTGRRTAKPAVSRQKKHSDSASSRQESALFSELPVRIAARAYALYEQRGRADGHDLDDWLEAERQIVTEFTKPRQLGG